MDEGHGLDNLNDRNIVIIKASLRNILRNPQHLTIYQDTIKTIHTVVTAAYLLAHYIFVNSMMTRMNLMRINISLLLSSQNA